MIIWINSNRYRFPVDPDLGLHGIDPDPAPTVRVNESAVTVRVKKYQLQQQQQSITMRRMTRTARTAPPWTRPFREDGAGWSPCRTASTRSGWCARRDCTSPVPNCSFRSGTTAACSRRISPRTSRTRPVAQHNIYLLRTVANVMAGRIRGPRGRGVR